MHFVMHPNGLHYFDPNQKRELTMVQTVKDTSEGFSEIQIWKAKEACRISSESQPSQHTRSEKYCEDQHDRKLSCDGC